MPKVSIIVPVYNVEKYLKECVESLRNQTLEDIEIILVDDESPDNCPAMCNHYAELDKRIKVVHKKNGGLGFARNSGLEVAIGEYVAFTDSDDYELPRTYETLYKIACEGGFDVVYYSFINKYVSTIKECNYIGKEQIRELLLNMVANPPESATDRSIQVSSCLGLYRRALLMNNSVRFHSERELISEDLVFNVDALLYAKKVAVTKHPFYYYRETSSSLTHSVRLDRHEKNKHLYLYLSRYLQDKGYGRESWLRCTRLFIGYSRSTIMKICKSKLSCDKVREWTFNVCKDNIWQTIKQDYPYKKLPIKYRLFFESICNRCFSFIWLLSKLS